MDINTKKNANTNTEDRLNIYSATQWWSRMFELFVNCRQCALYTWLVIFHPVGKKLPTGLFLSWIISAFLCSFMFVIAKVGVQSWKFTWKFGVFKTKLMRRIIIIDCYSIFCLYKASMITKLTACVVEEVKRCAFAPFNGPKLQLRLCSSRQRQPQYSRFVHRH